MFYLSYKNFDSRIFLFVGIFFSFLFLFSPQKAEAACTLTAGQMRNYDYTANFPLNWFSASVADNDTQPFIYADLKFSPDCVGVDSLMLTLKEADQLFNDTVLGPFQIPTITQQSLEQTLSFTAGDTFCSGVDSPDCVYLISVESEDFQTNQNITVGASYDCSGSCDNQAWQYTGTVHSGSMSNYQYGSFVSSLDPDYINFSGLSAENDGGLESENEGGIEVGNDSAQFTPETLDCNNGEGVACIENPLGDGSSLPAFIQSLLSIIIRAGIPLVVLALVFAGFKFVVARGNPDKISEAKKILLWTVIGTAVLLGAWTIATILTNTINLITASSIIYIV